MVKQNNIKTRTKEMIKSYLRTIVFSVLNAAQGSSKAIGGALAAVVVTNLSSRGFSIPEGFEGALALVGAALIGFGVVWLSPKNK